MRHSPLPQYHCILLLPVPAIHRRGVVPDDNHPHAGGRESLLQVQHVPSQSLFVACIAPSAESVGIISDIARLLPRTSQQSHCRWCCPTRASWSPETVPVMLASICKLAIEGSGPPQLRIARHGHLLPHGFFLRPLAGAVHQVEASTGSARPLCTNMTMELKALLLTSRLHNRSGPRQRTWMKHQQKNLWFRCCPNNYTRHKLRVNLSQTNDSWKRKRVSVSISRNDGNGNMFPLPLIFASSTESIIIVY